MSDKHPHIYNALRSLRTAALLLATGALFPAHALESDRNQPIYLEADSVFIDSAKGISTYEGAVRLSQGSLLIEADWAEIKKPAEAITQVHAKGKPVTFRQQSEIAGRNIRGNALRINYDLDSGNLTLTGSAQLWQGDDQFKGEHIVYDYRNKRVKAEGSGEAGDRVHVIIQPKGDKNAK